MGFIRQWVPGLGLVATVAAALYMVVHVHAQAADYRNAAFAEVRDAQGQVVLRGQFMPVDEDDDDVERKAELAQTGVDADATGEAEVEYETARPDAQEIEFSIRNVQPGATYTFVIDNIDVGSATADRRGRAGIEVDIQSGAVATRQ
jgi:hypothetical protein